MMKPSNRLNFSCLISSVCLPFSTVLLLALMSFSCGNDKGTILEEVSEEKSNEEITWLMELMEKDLLPDEAYLQMIPNQLIGFPLRNSRLYPGLKGVYAVYSNSEDSDRPHVVLQVIDGAGHHQFQHVNAVFKMLEMDLSESSEEIQASTMTYKGNRVLAKSILKKDQDKMDSEIEFIKDQRYHVTLTGHNLALDKLFAAVDVVEGHDFPE